MCFILTPTTEKKIADKDLIVYKICSSADEKKAEAYFQRYYYQVNILQPVIELIEIDETVFPSLTNKTACAFDYKDSLYLKLCGYNSERGWKAIQKGYHSLTTEYRCNEDRERDRMTIGQFIIPEGSTYYIDEARQMIVSDRIIYQKPLNI